MTSTISFQIIVIVMLFGVVSAFHSLWPGKSQSWKVPKQDCQRFLAKSSSFQQHYMSAVSEKQDEAEGKVYELKRQARLIR